MILFLKGMPENVHIKSSLYYKLLVLYHTVYVISVVMENLKVFIIQIKKIGKQSNYSLEMGNSVVLLKKYTVKVFLLYYFQFQRIKGYIKNIVHKYLNWY